MRQGLVAWLAGLAAGLLAVVAATPSLGHGFVGPGLDPGWQDGLRAAYEQQRIFGRDIFFTYGPLGFLSTRVTPAHLSWASGAMDATVWIVVAWLAWFLRRQAFGPALALLLAAAVVSARPFLAGMDLPLSAAWLGLACIAAGTDAVDGRLRSPQLALAGLALASVTFHVKANTGLVVPLVGAVWLVQRALGGRRRDVAVAGLVVPAAVIGAGALLLPVDVVGLARSSADIAGGYQDAQYLPFADAFVWRAWWASLAATMLLAVGGGVVWWRHRSFGPAASLAVVAFLSLIAIKQGFVRADAGHVAMALRTLPGVALLLAVATDGPRRRPALLAAAAAVAIVWAVQVPQAVAHPRVHLATVRTDLRAMLFRGRPGPDLTLVPTLPHGLVSRLGRGTVDVLAPDLVFVTREPRLHWQPRPTLQGYVATTAALDRLNAAHFLGPSAPEALLVTTTGTCVDDRCWIDEPATRVALWRRYQPVHQAGDVLVLQRRPTPLPLQEATHPDAVWDLGVPLALPGPGVGERLRVTLPVRQTHWAGLQRLALRPPGLAIRFDGALGGRRLRVWPALLNAGILVRPLAEDGVGLVRELSGGIGTLAHPRALTVDQVDGWGYVAAGPAQVQVLRVETGDAEASRSGPSWDGAAAVPEVRAWRTPEACAAGHVDHWPGATHRQVAGWAVVPGAARPADRVLFTTRGAEAVPVTVAVQPTLGWRADVFEVTRRGETLLSGFRAEAWFPASRPLRSAAVEAWAWDAASGDAWQLCWAIPR